MRFLFLVEIFFLMGEVWAGGSEYTESEIKQMTLNCDQKISGTDCATLAGETLCGQGYNEETAALMEQSCEVHQFNCEKSNAAACKEYGMCLLMCADRTFDSEAYGMYTTDMYMSCHLSIQANSPQERQKKAIDKALAVFTKTCTDNIAEGCVVAGEIYSLEESLDIEKVKARWSKACQLDSAEGCTLMSKQLTAEAD